MDLEKALMGRTITGLALSDDRGTLTLQTTTGEVILQTYGD